LRVSISCETLPGGSLPSVTGIPRISENAGEAP
jgi:hypothetical protein